MEINYISNALRAYRAERRITLREFCLQNRLDPVTVSRLERGLPSGDELDPEKLPLLMNCHPDKLDALAESVKKA